MIITFFYYLFNFILFVIIISQGSVSVLKGKELKEVRKLVKGEAFGEQALYYNTNRTMTCRADVDNVTFLYLNKKSF